jgi:hypothetical protein
MATRPGIGRVGGATPNKTPREAGVSFKPPRGKAAKWQARQEADKRKAISTIDRRVKTSQQNFNPRLRLVKP